MKIFFLLTTLLSAICGNAQRKDQLNAFGLSLPVISNNSEATYYALGNRKEPNGRAVSYGLIANYNRTIYKNFYGVLSAGYFKQKFNIKRPFHYEDSTNLLFHTQSYLYDNIILAGGIGICKELKNDFQIGSNITYNIFISFRQKYIIDKEYKKWQINNKGMSIGQVIYLSFDIGKRLSKNYSLSFSPLIPLYTNWNDDEIFFKYDYSNDTQQIARNKFSIGASITYKYYFHH